MSNRLKLSDFVPPPRWFHFAYIVFPKPRSNIPHSHDFIEIFRCAEGMGIHQCNGHDMVIKAGDLMFIAPEDRHGFRAIHQQRWQATNLAFSPAIISDLTARYPEIMRRMLARDRHGNPCIHSLSPTSQETIKRLEQQLQAGPQTRFALDSFLFNLLSLLESQSQANEHPPAMPEWLIYAATEIRHPRHFRDGMKAFVELAGHCQAHVIRETHRWLGKTPGELIHELRLLHAQYLLSSSDSSLKNICSECGFRSESYFYASFRRRFGQTPRQYRLRQQAIALPHR